MTLLDLIQSFRASRQPQQQPASPQGSQFLEGLLSGSYAGSPPGFSMPNPNVIGVEGSKYYPEFRFGYSGNPASERLGIVPQGGLLPGMAMQLAQSQYFAPGTGQGINLAGQKPAAPTAPAGPPGGEWVHWADGMGTYFSPFQTKPGQSVADAYIAHVMGRGVPGGEGGGGADSPGGGGGSGCLAAETLVEMADGSLCPVADLCVGDEVKDGGRVQAVMVFDASDAQWYSVLGVRCTGEHAFLTTYGWDRAEHCGFPVESAGDLSYNLITENHRLLLAPGGRRVVAADYIEHDPHGPVFAGQNDRALEALNLSR